MRTPTLFLMLLIPFMVFVTGSCRSVKDPEFRAMENFELKQLGLKQSGFELDMVYFNPNQMRLQLKKAEGKVWVENNYLGKFEVDSLIRVPANADFRVPVKLKVDMGHVLKNSMFALLKKEVTLKIEGTAKVGKAGVFIKYPIRYEGKHSIDEILR